MASTAEVGRVTCRMQAGLGQSQKGRCGPEGHPTVCQRVPMVNELGEEGRPLRVLLGVFRRSEGGFTRRADNGGGLREVHRMGLRFELWDLGGGYIRRRRRETGRGNPMGMPWRGRVIHGRRCAQYKFYHKRPRMYYAAPGDNTCDRESSRCLCCVFPRRGAARRVSAYFAEEPGSAGERN